MGLARILRAAAPLTALLSTAVLVYGSFSVAFPSGPVARLPSVQARPDIPKTLEPFSPVWNDLRREFKSPKIRTEAGAPSTPPRTLPHSSRLFEPMMAFDASDERNLLAKASVSPYPSRQKMAQPTSTPVPLTLGSTGSLYLDIDFNHEVIEHANFSEPPNLLASFADELFCLPDTILDPLIALLRAPADSDPFVAPCPEARGMTRRILDVEIDRAARANSLKSFWGNLTRAEQKFFGGFQGLYLSTPGFEEGLEDVSMKDFEYEQGRLALDALKTTFLARYKFAQVGDRIRDDGMMIHCWEDWDFVVLPPVIGGYLYVHGFEKRFTAQGVKFHFRLEALQRAQTHWEDGRDFRAAAQIAMETPIPWINIIASTGLYSGEPKLDFIGIGTDLDIVRKAVRLE